jgi:hypothetical protein
MTALREAAQQAALAEPQEPDLWGAGYEAGYAAGMAERPAEPVQEPVACLHGGSMNRDDIIRMAREAWDRDTDPWLTYEQAFLERFAHLVYEATFRDANLAASRTILDAAVLEEREACAKVCDSEAARLNSICEARPALVAGICAAAIRARGEK